MSHWSTVINAFYDTWKEQLVPMKKNDLKKIQAIYREQQLIKLYDARKDAIEKVKTRVKQQASDKPKGKRGRPRKTK